jgi:hypothetical protein
MEKTSGWVDSLKLCVAEYGNDRNAWPLHARTVITGAMSAIMRKAAHHRLKLKINKRGGGRGGIEYQLE